MENEIVKREKKFMLLTYSGSKHIISEQQEKMLRGIPEKTMINLNGNQVSSSNISEIISLDEYYFQHQDEKPAPEVETFKSPERVPYTLAKNRRALESMVIGLNKCVTEQGYPISVAQQGIMDKIVGRLKALDGLTDETYNSQDINFSKLSSL